MRRMKVDLPQPVMRGGHGVAVDPTVTWEPIFSLTRVGSKANDDGLIRLGINNESTPGLGAQTLAKWMHTVDRRSFAVRTQRSHSRTLAIAERGRAPYREREWTGSNQRWVGRGERITLELTLEKALALAAHGRDRERNNREGLGRRR